MILSTLSECYLLITTLKVRHAFLHRDHSVLECTRLRADNSQHDLLRWSLLLGGEVVVSCPNVGVAVVLRHRALALPIPRVLVCENVDLIVRKQNERK